MKLRRTPPLPGHFSIQQLPGNMLKEEVSGFWKWGSLSRVDYCWPQFSLQSWASVTVHLSVAYSRR